MYDDWFFYDIETPRSETIVLREEKNPTEEKQSFLGWIWELFFYENEKIN
jgi:hypothetical protein